ncbi:cupredoxin domain-containing protein [Aminobacter ciceronei]|uniref:Cupredoxin-like copper-binding protein n=1 Tax=Aminobacter ciceronei TaxID=150723 RepID=A0ABR6CGG9_9HYPH|nr:cupredoxin family protein [Aminobacter ciceronei]MBA8910251.1 putative cupredoxin-like copper-binding protein [Aminobacter ciceronei]MBA9024011.1 putative cupredoxin-like copper-binding protein [Aminobacter ciceronei]
MILKILALVAVAGTVAACTSQSVLPGTTSLDPATALSPPTPAAGHQDKPGAPPHSHDAQQAYGEPGDPNKPARLVTITMSETNDGRMIFSPSNVQARAGEQVRFKIRNAGEIDHEFVLATAEANQKHSLEMQKNPDMEHDDPNAIRVASGQTGEMLWKFTNTGGFEFACLIPGHREAGMIGLAAVN